MALPMIAVESKPQMTLEELKRSRAWMALTSKQRTWVETFIASLGDAQLATRTAYYSAEKNVAAHACQLRANRSIRAVLDLYYGRTEADERYEFFAAIQKKIMRGTASIADVELVKRVCKERGWEEPVNLPAGKNGYVSVEKRHQVGDVVTQNGKSFRVTEVDSHGKITKAEPMS